MAKLGLRRTRSGYRVPDLLVDGVQLLLEHHGQRLCVGVAAGRQQVHGAEQRLPVVVVDVGHFRVALEVVASQDAQLLRAPLVLPQRLGLRTPRGEGGLGGSIFRKGCNTS